MKSHVTSLSLHSREQMLLLTALLGAGWNCSLSRVRLRAAVSAGQNDIALAPQGLINAILPSHGAVTLVYDAHHLSLEVRIRWTPFPSKAKFTRANDESGPI